MNEHRLSGMKYMAAGIAVSAAWILVFNWLHAQGNSVRIWGAGWGVPGAIAMIGAVKVATAAPFSETNARWEAMASWKKTVYGFGLMGLGFALVCGVIATFIYLPE